jgi:tRNA dimethylallyltransferase
MSSRSHIIALVGPTASGKSELALQLARACRGVILSCDSLLVYKDLNIGTAKPTEKELAEVPHFGVNIVSVDTAFNAGDYVRYATPVIADHVARGTPVIIVGGTGFYLKALLCGVWDAPPTQPEYRARLQQQVATLQPEERQAALHKMLHAVDAAYAAKVKPQDTYRVIRALEIIHVTGVPLSKTLSERDQKDALPYPVKIFGVTRNKLDLERRIVQRANSMFADGLVAETRALLARYPASARPFACVGYHEVAQHLSGVMDLPECRERVVISTRQLAKKQMTFFRTFPKPIEWFTLPSQQDDIWRCASSELQVGF